MEAIDEIKKAIKENRVIIGSNRVIKYLKLGKVSKVFLAKNCPENIKKDILYYSKIGNIKVVELSLTNMELGTISKRPHSIASLAIIGEKSDENKA